MKTHDQCGVVLGTEARRERGNCARALFSCARARCARARVTAWNDVGVPPSVFRRKAPIGREATSQHTQQRAPRPRDRAHRMHVSTRRGECRVQHVRDDGSVPRRVDLPQAQCRVRVFRAMRDDAMRDVRTHVHARSMCNIYVCVCVCVEILSHVRQTRLPFCYVVQKKRRRLSYGTPSLPSPLSSCGTRTRHRPTHVHRLPRAPLGPAAARARIPRSGHGGHRRHPGNTDWTVFEKNVRRLIARNLDGTVQRTPRRYGFGRVSRRGSDRRTAHRRAPAIPPSPFGGRVIDRWFGCKSPKKKCAMNKKEI